MLESSFLGANVALSVISRTFQGRREDCYKHLRAVRQITKVKHCKSKLIYLRTSYLCALYGGEEKIQFKLIGGEGERGKEREPPNSNIKQHSRNKNNNQKYNN